MCDAEETGGMTSFEGSADAPWRVLVVDDDERSAENNATALNRAQNTDAFPYPVEAVAMKSFEDALALVRHGGIDLLVLDVFDQAGASITGVVDPEPVGRSVCEKVRTERFLPIIFLTSFPDQVDYDENPPFVQIVSKRADYPSKFLAAVKHCLDSPFPTLYRDVRSHIASTSRRFMIDFVELHWDDLEDRPVDVTHLLMRRLGVSFDMGHRTTADSSAEMSAESSVPPIRYYIVPAPVEHRMGDIIVEPIGADADENDTIRWYVVMTPSCDLVEGRTKAEAVVLAECIPLTSFSEYQDWVTAESASNSKRDKLERLLKSNPRRGSKNRYFYLPAAWTLPDLMVDLQRIAHVPHSDLQQYKKQASLDDPYAAELSHQFYCYLGRVGTPDLDLDALIDAMRARDPE